MRFAPRLINFSTSAAGEIRISILDKDGNEIQGYSYEDCLVLIGNEIKKRVSWINYKSLKELSGQPIRLHFMMKDADLYSIKFE